MKTKIYITLILLCVGTLGSQAQNGLEINRIFKDFHRADNVTETIVSGAQLVDLGLDTYRSIIVSGDDAKDSAAIIAKAVTADASRAVSKEVSYVDGHLFYAQYTLKPIGNRNRYIFFVDNTLKGDSRVMLVYMEGQASPEKVRRLIRKK